MNPTLKERTNFARISRVLTDLCTEVLRVILEQEINPTNVKKAVTRQQITSPQKDKLRLYVKEKEVIDKARINGYRDFDLSLLYKLIKYLCSRITPPTKGWYSDRKDNKPDPVDVEVGDDIERIHLLRNCVYGHAPNTSIDDQAFLTYWTELKGIMMRMTKRFGAPFDKTLDAMENEPMDHDLMSKYIAAAEEQRRSLDIVKVDLQEHESRLTKAENERNDIKGDLQEHESRITKTENETNVIKGDLQEHESRLTKAENETNVIKVDLQEQESRLTKAENETNDIKGDIEKHGERLKNTEDDAKHVKWNLEEHEDRLEEHEDRLEEHEDRLKKAESEKTEIRNELREHKQRLARTETDVKEIIDNIKMRNRKRPKNMDQRYSSALVSCCIEFDNVFVETEAYHEAKKKLQSNFHLLISGNPGDGKTTLARHLLLEFILDGYSLHELSNIENITRLFQDGKKQVVFIDDIFGVTMFDRSITEMASRVLTTNKMRQLYKLQGRIIIVMTSRKSIMKKAMKVLKHKDVFEPPYVVDLSNPGYNVCEKQKILSEHLSHCNLQDSNCLMNDLVKRAAECNGPHGFPHCAQMFACRDEIRNRGIAFFENPLEYIAKDIERLKFDEPFAYAILCMLMLRGGKIRKEELEQYHNSTDLSNIAKHFCKELTTDVTIHIEAIQDLYIKSDHTGKILFRHESILETVCVVCGEKFQNEIISVLPFVYITKLVATKNNMNGGLKLYLSDDRQMNRLVIRFWKEISTGNIKEVSEHPSCSDSRFVDRLFSIPLHEEIKSYCGLNLQSMLLLTDTGTDRYEDAFGFNGTLLYWSAVSNREPLCRKILQRSLFKSSDQFWYCNQLTATLLHACHNGFDISILKELLKLGANPKCKMDIHDTLFSAPCPCDICLIHSTYGTTPLHALMLCDVRNRKRKNDFSINEITDRCTAQKVEMLLSYTCDVDATDENGYDPLWHAVVANNLLVTEILIRSGASTRKFYKESKRNIISVAKSKEMVDILTRHGTEVSYRDSRGLSLLHISEHTEVISYLLKDLDINIKNRQGRTPLHTASKAEVVHTLIDLGSYINSTDKEGKSPLHISTNIEVMRALIQRGANTNAVDQYCKTPLYYFIDDKQAIMELIKAGADVNTSQAEGNHLLMCVKNSDVLKTLVGAGARANKKKIKTVSKEISGRIERCFPSVTNTALLVHAEKGTLNPEILESLLIAGEDIYVENAKGRNLIHCVVSSATSDEECTAIIEKLICHGVSSNKLDHDSCTPLHLAIRENIKLKRAIVFLLELEHKTLGVEPNLIYVLLRSKKSCTFSHFKFFVYVLQALLQYSSCKYNRLTSGDTILHEAMNIALDDQGIFTTVKIMLDFGCDPTIRNDYNETPILIALNKNFGYVTLLLLQNGGFDDYAINETVSLCRSHSDPLISQCIIKELNRMDDEKLISLKKDVRVEINNYQIENTVELMERIQELLGSFEDDDVAKQVIDILITHENVNFLNPEKETFLMTALYTSQKRQKVINHLLSKGADTNAIDRRRQNILHYLFKEQRIYVNFNYIRNLIQHGFILRGKNSIVLSTNSKIHWESLMEIQNIFLEHGADINETDNHGQNALYNVLTRRKGKECLMLVRFLMEHGIEINHCSKDGRFPIHAALKSQVDIEVVDELIDSGAIIEARDPKGRTLVHLAAKYGNLKTLTSVINAGADINAECTRGWNALHYLMQNAGHDINKHGMLAMLIQRGMNINKKSQNGETPLHIALYSEYKRDSFIGETSFIRHMLLRGALLLLGKYTKRFVLRDFENSFENAENIVCQTKDPNHKIQFQQVHELLHITSMLFSTDHGCLGRVFPNLANVLDKASLENCFQQMKNISRIKGAIRNELQRLDVRIFEENTSKAKEPREKPPTVVAKKEKKGKCCLS